MSKLLVHRVASTLIAASTRRHARRRPRLTPPKPKLTVSAAMDRNPETNKYVGYHRDEIGSESLVGTVKHFDCHAFLVHGDADAWPAVALLAAALSALRRAWMACSGTYSGSTCS